MKWLLGTLIVIYCISGHSHECKKFLDSNVNLKDQTSSLISYLDQLIEKGVLTTERLERLNVSLQVDGDLVNPISFQESQSRVDFYIHYTTINNILRSSHIDILTVELWLELKLKKASEDQKTRDEGKKQTHNIFRPLVFHPVKAGTFLMTRSNYKRSDTLPKKFNVTLTQDFEMQETQVTQAQWFDLMGQNPASVIDEDTAVIIKSSTGTALMNLDHPIETVSFFSMLVFANKLSIQHGLEPVYDLSNIEMTGNASQGTLALKYLYKDGELEKLRINAPEGNIYKAEGYRLPSDAEWEFVARARGLQTESGHYSLEGMQEWYEYNKKTINPQHMHFAWGKSNVEIRKWTRPVGLLFPLIIDDYPFYDLYGNVSERVFDAYEVPTSPTTGNEDEESDTQSMLDPLGDKIGWLLRGRSFHNDTFDITTDRNEHHLNGDYYVGFRLVRSINLN